MKRLSIQTLAPALALLAVGCSTPTAMQSTEYDDVYYTSSDKTEYVQPEVNVQNDEASETTEAITDGGVINPEYTDDNVVLHNYDADEYYDGRSYNPRDNWYRPSHSYIDPYWGSAYSPMHSSRYLRAMAMRDPFYDPFYHDPFYYDPFYSSYYGPYWRSGVSISITYGSVWGNPYWGNRYAGHYNRWYPYNNYYNGFYHGYNYGRNQYMYDRPGYVQTRKVQYGPRDERSKVITNGRTDESGRPERGTLSSDKQQQQTVMPATGRTERTGRTDRSGNTTTTTKKEVITTKPDATRQTRPQRTRGNTPAVEPANIVPAQNATPERSRRTRGEVVPASETGQPSSTETRRTERRERPAPVRQTPARTYERSESRPAPVRTYERSSESRSAPVRSSGSSTGSGSSTERRSSGGRPTRGGN